MPRHSHRITLPCPRQAVFDLFLRPAQRVALMPPDWSARLVSGPETLAAGDRLTIQTKHFGLPRTGVSEIAEVVAGERIVERQVEGPFRSCVHVQTFAEAPGGATALEDVIEYELPGGMLGLFLTPAVAEEQLRAALAHRDRALGGLLGAGR